MTERKTSLENITLFYLCYFANISTHATCTKTANYAGTKLVSVVSELTKRMKNSPLCAHVHHKTLNLFISHAGRLFFLIKPIVLWRCLCRRRSRCLVLCHSAAMLSLRGVRKRCFCTASLAQTRIQCEACCAKTKLFILLRLNMAAE